jgi:hypothetical protein
MYVYTDIYIHIHAYVYTDLYVYIYTYVSIYTPQKSVNHIPSTDSGDLRQRRSFDIYICVYIDININIYTCIYK